MAKIPLLKVYVPNPPENEDTGVIPKPPGCSFCPCRTTNIGYVPDAIPPSAKVLFVLAAPRPDDAVSGRPLGGAMGNWEKREFIYKLGHKDEDVALCHVIRCAPKLDKDGLHYPTGPRRVKAEERCRQYDEQIKVFNPNVFLATFDLSSIKYGPSHLHLIRKDVEKVFRLADKGYRPALVCGKEAGELFFPYAFTQGAGGLKNWRSHFYVGNWKNVETTKEYTKDLGFSQL